MAAAENMIGKVGVLVGRVFAENADGVRRELKLNDPVYADDVILTFGGGRVEVVFGPNNTFLVAEDQRVPLDSTIYGDGEPEATQLAVLERDSRNNFGVETQIANNTGSLDHLLNEATAAGLGGNGAGPAYTGSNTLGNLERVNEALFINSPQSQAEVSGTGPVAEVGRLSSLPAEPVTQVLSLSAAQVQEGNDLVHNVVLSNRSDQVTRFGFAIQFENGTPADVGTAQFSNGVTLVDGQLLVPAGVSAFTITLPTINDHVAGPNSTLNLVVGGVTVQDTIVDAGTSPMRFGAETLAFNLAEPVPHVAAPSQSALSFHDVLSGPDFLSAALGPPHPAAAVQSAVGLQQAHLDLAAMLAPVMQDGLHAQQRGHESA